MIVPSYWAETKRKGTRHGKQITVKRFGWSNDSLEAAEQMAAERADAALSALVAGRAINRIEKKVAYNGADGLPIREEVLERHGEEVITRNSYGAQCLNSPRVLFADVDHASGTPSRLTLLVIVALAGLAVIAGLLSHSAAVAAIALVIVAVISGPVARLVFNAALFARGGNIAVARKKIEGFFQAHPAWGARLYTTPNGIRIMVTHKLFSADDSEVAAFFKEISADPLYVRMCQNQKCFRARLTAKPWRIGIGSHMSPRPGIWPVAPEKRAQRTRWIDMYERKADAFAACRFDRAIGATEVHPAVRSVVAMHDKKSKATRTDLDIA